MKRTVKFQAVVSNNVIMIPDKYLDNVPHIVNVTLAPVSRSHIVKGSKSNAGELPKNYFSTFSFSSKNWKFNREEANAR